MGSGNVAKQLPVEHCSSPPQPSKMFTIWTVNCRDGRSRGTLPSVLQWAALKHPRIRVIESPKPKHLDQKYSYHKTGDYRGSFPPTQPLTTLHQTYGDLFATKTRKYLKKSFSRTKLPSRVGPCGEKVDSRGVAFPSFDKPMTKRTKYRSPDNRKDLRHFLCQLS